MPQNQISSFESKSWIFMILPLIFSLHLSVGVADEISDYHNSMELFLKSQPPIKPKIKRVTRKIAVENPRLSHAKELLGSHYQGSIVKTGEKIRNVNKFVLQTLKADLPTKWKSKAVAIQKVILSESKKYGFDPIFLLAVIEHESSFNPQTVGGVGEIGLMQLRPETAKWITEIYEIPWRGKKSLYDPSTNIRIGAAFLNHLREGFENHGRLYLAAYNMGQVGVRRALAKGVWPKDYPSKVMENYIRFYTDLNEAQTPKGHT